MAEIDRQAATALRTGQDAVSGSIGRRAGRLQPNLDVQINDSRPEEAKNLSSVCTLPPQPRDGRFRSPETAITRC